MTKNSAKQTGEQTIQALSQRQHLLKRMGLTFGDPELDGVPYSSQKSVAVREILDNALDEIRSGFGEHVRLHFYADRSFMIQDSGRGIPVSKNVDSQGNPISSLALALSHLQAGGKFSTDSKRYSSGLNGLGGSAVVNVATRASVWVYDGKREHFLEFKDGIPGYFKNEDPKSEFTPLKDLTYVKSTADKRPAATKKNYETGTKIHIWLDDSVFSSSNPYDADDIVARFRSTAFLVPTLHAEVYNELNLIEDPETGESAPEAQEFYFPGGIDELIDMSQSKPKLHETVTLKGEAKYVEKNVPVLQNDGNITNEDVERVAPYTIAFRYDEGYELALNSYVNTIHTKLNGVHADAFSKAIQNAFNPRFGSMRGLLKKGDELPTVEDFMEGLTAVVAVEVSEPTFTSQSKEGLKGREVARGLTNAMTESLGEWVADRKNADALTIIAKKVVQASRNRQRAKEARDLNRKKNEIKSAALPSKLLDCDLAGSEDAELYICEGDSAVGSMKAARDGTRNALMGIRGKIKNAHKASISETLKNTEVADILKVIGAGSGKDFDIEKMRYGRIFIAVDADPDGSNIACLLFTIFWHLMRPVLEENRLFMIVTPLFVISTSGRNPEKHFARDEAARDEIVEKLDKAGKKYTISRLKGLGEAPPEILEETAINPETRSVLQVTSESMPIVAQQMDMLLGTETGGRKDWIIAAINDDRVNTDVDV